MVVTVHSTMYLEKFTFPNEGHIVEAQDDECYLLFDTNGDTKLWSDLRQELS